MGKLFHFHYIVYDNERNMKIVISISIQFIEKFHHWIFERTCFYAYEMFMWIQFQSEKHHSNKRHIQIDRNVKEKMMFEQSQQLANTLPFLKWPDLETSNRIYQRIIFVFNLNNFNDGMSFIHSRSLSFAKMDGHVIKTEWGKVGNYPYYTIYFSIKWWK